MEQMKNVNIHEDLLVKESNKLINLPAEQMTAIEKKILLILISQIKVDDEDFKFYTIPIKTFQEITDTKNMGIYSFARSIARSLLKKVVFIEDESGFQGHSWLYWLKYEKGEGHFTAQIHPKMKPYLLDLKTNFTTFHLEEILRVKSFFSIRLYEILSQYRDTGWRKIKVDNLRCLLGLDNPDPGIQKTEKKRYGRYNDFKRFVLDKAIKEINKDTDLRVKYTENKKGRKVISLDFKIKEIEKSKSTEKNFFWKRDKHTEKIINWNREHEKTKEDIKKLDEIARTKEEEDKIREQIWSQLSDGEKENYLKQAEKFLINKYAGNFISNVLIRDEAIKIYMKLK